MLTIRLQRVGKKGDPSYRIVSVDSRRSTISGRFVDVLGSYNPQRGEPQFKTEAIKDLISKGAKVSGTVNNLLVKAGIIKGEKVNVSPKFKAKEEPKKEATAEVKTEAAPAETVSEETAKAAE